MQKLMRAQRLGVAGVVMMNSEAYDERLQVMTCPNQERGGGNEVGKSRETDDGRLFTVHMPWPLECFKSLIS